jgi:mercuric ion transport protein
MAQNSVGRIPGPMLSLIGGAAAAVGASACCVGPLLLVVLGVGGAWGSRLAALEPYQPLFIAAALGFFGFTFEALYRKQPDCAKGKGCGAPGVRRRQRAVFWTLAALSAALLMFPAYAPLFY